MSDYRSHMIAAIGTAVVLALLVLLLVWVKISAPRVVEDEGIELAFGDIGEGGGMTEAQPAFSELPPQPEAEPAPAPQSEPSNNDLMVQEDESPALAQQREEEERRKAEQEELLRQQREAQAREQAEREAREKELAEQRAKQQAQQQAIERANKMGALFGNAQSAEGANAQSASNDQTSGGNGNPVYKGYGGPKGGPTWTLKGRDCVHLAQPSSDFKQAGKVLVNIEVDTQGNVTKASIGDGTTISDSYTQQLALEAAKKTKFTKGEMAQRGQILYSFKLN